MIAVFKDEEEQSRSEHDGSGENIERDSDEDKERNTDEDGRHWSDVSSDDEPDVSRPRRTRRPPYRMADYAPE